MDATIITALGGLLTVINGILIGVMTSRSNVQKTELDSLRTTIETLQTENKRLSDQIKTLETDRDQEKKEKVSLEDEFIQFKREVGKEIAELERKITILTNQLKKLGVKPETGPL